MSGKWAVGLRWSVAGIVALAGFWPAAGRAQQSGQTHAVRLSSVDGQVQLSMGGQLMTDHAVANVPVFEGTRIVTADDGRAELQFDDGSIARIPPDSSLTLARLGSDGSAQLVLDSGMGYFELEGNQGGAFQVDFDDSVVTADGFTVMRVKLDQPPGELAVFSGNAHLDEASGTVQVAVRGGESVTLNATDPTLYNLAESIDPDSWDAWNFDRDQALSSAAAAPTQATEGMPDSNNPAWGDLNANGAWYNTPDQGYVWSPYEASDAGWDPYGDGYWMDEPNSGYMWVSGEPWGYLPYQCGVWNYYNTFGWGWSPGMCQTWWGGGWGLNIGYAPTWYRRPVRPGPVHPGPPRPRNPRPLQAGNGGQAPLGPRPIISVNRRMPAMSAVLPQRAPGTPVMLGGSYVEPLHPGAVRARYAPSTTIAHGANRPRWTQPANAAANRPGYTPSNRSTYRPAGSDLPGRSGYTPAWPGAARPAPAQGGYRPPSGGRSEPAPRAAPAPRSEPAPRSAPAPRSSSSPHR